jgi:hypothetical protein
MRAPTEENRAVNRLDVTMMERNCLKHDGTTKKRLRTTERKQWPTIPRRKGHSQAMTSSPTSAGHLSTSRIPCPKRAQTLSDFRFSGIWRRMETARSLVRPPRQPANVSPEGAPRSRSVRHVVFQARKAIPLGDSNQQSANEQSASNSSW